jgi:hypothetical protein
MPTTERRLMESHLDLPIRKVHRHTWPGAGIPKNFSLYENLLKSGWKSGLSIKAKRSSKGIEVRLHNDKAGHAVPTGDPERFVLVRVRSFGLQGREVWSAKKRIGQIWEWSPAKKLGDNRIAPGETRILNFKPPRAMETVLEILNIRLSKETVKSMVQSKGLNENFLPDANQKIKKLPKIYPYSTYIYRQIWDGAARVGKVANPEDLIKLSDKEREISPNERGYE